ncbi:uncharacterized protein LOC105702629 [Orussus abietinus]|uniref:uncharacterized protein LOC105702629 n=1 Tax=Orussus abietinus TaxID=222816 RepID=UPI00062542AB|nr:uncharacterized protein LOC105702629 [Orussus abietinus]XP_012285749.1 uncharacterized protein LOC105702629 [Orussus abietinus]XP_012285750.1 uncharacterized protein LOC105702629 [Orussus abietinus]
MRQGEQPHPPRRPRELVDREPTSMSSTTSMDPDVASESASGSNGYAYRPLTTRHRRAGSTGTTGDEEYTSDEEELYGDEAESAGCPSLHASQPVGGILRSDLARAATDLFGYAEKEEHTGLFDEEDSEFNASPRPSRPASKPSLLGQPGSTRGVGRLFNGVVRISKESKVDPEKPEVAVAERKRSCSPECSERKEPSTHPDPDEEVLQPEGPSAASETLQSTGRNHVDLDVHPPGKGDEPGGPAPGVREEKRARSSSPTALQRERALSEVREHAVAKLQDEVRRVREELRIKDEEVTRLTRIRQDVEAELEDLTASLFQEAHNMVREANVRQATAERLFEESRMKAEVLAAEVAALKTLVLTSTPARPNKHLHPQIDARGRTAPVTPVTATPITTATTTTAITTSATATSPANSEDTQPGLFALRRHRRSPSHFNLKYGRENSPPDSPSGKEQRLSGPEREVLVDGTWCMDRVDGGRGDRDEPGGRFPGERDADFGLEVDPRVHAEFLSWKANPRLDKDDPFVARIFREDIDLCLDFPNVLLGARVKQAVLDGIVFIEAVSDKAGPSFPTTCALLETPRRCRYRMRLGDQEKHWHSISRVCRNRIIAVCDCLNYLRYIERGLVKSSVQDMYWEITRLRKDIVLARLGLAFCN